MYCAKKTGPIWLSYWLIPITHFSAFNITEHSYITTMNTSIYGDNIFFLFLLIYIYNLLNRIRVLSKYNDDTVRVGAIGQCRFTLGYIPIGKSSGHCLLSLLTTGGTSVRTAINSFIWFIFLFLYLLAWECITSLMNGIFRSSCKVWLETYHGAFVIILKVGDNICRQKFASWSRQKRVSFFRNSCCMGKYT
jgi:hypothetical protein